MRGVLQQKKSKENDKSQIWKKKISRTEFSKKGIKDERDLGFVE